jgi:hypothetical protein
MGELKQRTRGALAGRVEDGSFADARAAVLARSQRFGIARHFRGNCSLGLLTAAAMFATLGGNRVIGPSAEQGLLRHAVIRAKEDSENR